MMELQKKVVDLSKKAAFQISKLGAVSRIVTFARALPLLLTLFSPALAAGYTGLEGEAVYYSISLSSR